MRVHRGIEGGRTQSGEPSGALIITDCGFEEKWNNKKTEGMGLEPTEHKRAHTVSNGALSTTQPTFHY